MSDRPLTPVEVLTEEFVKLHGTIPIREDLSRRLPEFTPQKEGDPKADSSGLAMIYEAIHDLDPRRAALCLSGGGIRSATFSLGVLQGLARHGWLPYFHYLSTVSGGGYIGGWLTAWIHRSGFDNVVAGLSACTSQPESGAAAAATACPEPQQISRLRAYSNYLSPRIGFSADFWTLIAVIFRNLLLHWAVLIPLLAAILMLPRLTVALTVAQPPDSIQTILLGVALILGAFGIAYVDTDLPSSTQNPWCAGRFVFGFLLPFVTAAFLLSLFWAWHTQKDAEGIALLICIYVGIGVHAAGVISAYVIRSIRGRALSCTVMERIFDIIAVVLSGVFGGIVLWFISTKLFPKDVVTTCTGIYIIFAVPSLLVALSLGTTLYIGLSRMWTTEDDREWWARAGGWLLMVTVVWVAGHGLVIYGPPALLALGATAAANLVSLGGLTGVLTAVWGYLGKGTLASEASKVWSAIRRVGQTLGTAVFALTLLLLISLAISHLLDYFVVTESGNRIFVYREILMKTPYGLVFYILTACACVALIFSIAFGINTFSLNSIYGNRLVRAYLGASTKTSQRRPHPFTGFDPNDNVRMSELWPAGANDRNAGFGIFHVVNLALNLVKGDRLEWQQRKAESFTVTPLHSGSLNLGYRPSESYGGESGISLRKLMTILFGYRPSASYKEESGISLGKAMTISGAAASPNMGYHSSPLVAFLLTFFNARLGWWLPNPGKAGERVWHQGEPCLGIYPLVKEALGHTNDRSRFVYLSDGGHFENLALYEMVYRRCGFILVIDAACDPKHECDDLSSAIRKIRTDLGVPITFSSLPGPSSESGPGAPYAFGTVEYTKVDPGGRDGTIIYIKPVLRGDEPIDVMRYASSHKNPKNPFPQQSTADQFFDEAQFESYRQLGEHIVRNLVADHSLEDRDKVFSRNFDLTA